MKNVKKTTKTARVKKVDTALDISQDKLDEFDSSINKIIETKKESKETVLLKKIHSQLVTARENNISYKAISELIFNTFNVKISYQNLSAYIRENIENKKNDKEEE